MSKKKHKQNCECVFCDGPLKDKFFMGVVDDVGYLSMNEFVILAKIQETLNKLLVPVVEDGKITRTGLSNILYVLAKLEMMNPTKDECKQIYNAVGLHPYPENRAVFLR